MVSLVEVPNTKSGCAKVSALFKEIMAIRYSQMTHLSITKFLESPVAAKRPKLTRQ